MGKFAELSYRAQVRRLRQMAQQVLERYPIRATALQFLQHGENATFQVKTTTRAYLLRLHRNGYHTKEGILEELRWLQYLAEHTDIRVQVPVVSHAGILLERCEDNGMPARYCDLLTWQPGRMRYENITQQNMRTLGLLFARLHTAAEGWTSTNRNYWSAQGLLGPHAKLGSLDVLEPVIPKEYPDLDACRTMVLAKLASYEKKYPDKRSFIHADLHFGNMLWDKGEVLPIDFDDAGFGFHGYDLSIPLYSANERFQRMKPDMARNCVQAFFAGYSERRNLSAADLEHIPYFLLARKLSMVAWRYNRGDNPRLLERFWQVLPDQMKLFRKALKEGPEPL